MSLRKKFDSAAGGSSDPEVETVSSKCKRMTGLTQERKMQKDVKKHLGGEHANTAESK